jgi:hypothetical protein
MHGHSTLYDLNRARREVMREIVKIMPEFDQDYVRSIQSELDKSDVPHRNFDQTRFHITSLNGDIKAALIRTKSICDNPIIRQA